MPNFSFTVIDAVIIDSSRLLRAIDQLCSVYFTPFTLEGIRGDLNNKLHYRMMAT